MIRPMIDPSFCQYGAVERFGSLPNRTRDRIPVSHRQEIRLYRFPVDTVWDYAEGMTLLVILDGQQRKEYYLDRTVTLRAGVCFGFCAMGDGSVILGDSALLTPEACVGVLDLSKDAPESRRLQVFTLFRQVGRDGLFFRGERHAPLELVYVEKGVLQNYCDGRKFTLHPHELLLFSPDQWHMQQADQEVRFLTVSFSWEGVDFSGRYNRVMAASPELQRSVRSLLQEYEQELPERDEFLLAQIKLLLLQILRLPVGEETARKPSPASERAHRMLLDKAMQVVSERIYGKLTVSDLAAAVNVSTSQLTALFKTYLGLAPAKYITHIRLEESKSLLSEKSMSIGEIADLLGYASVQHYSKQFHSWFGCAPSAYAGRKGE